MRARRWQMVAALLAALLAAPACGLLPGSHYGAGSLPLPAGEGWVPLPAARWLLNPGIEPTDLLLCPRDACAQPGFVARIELTGAEQGFAGLLAADPVGTLSAAKPTRAADGKAAPSATGATMVTPLAIGAWRGGLVRLESARTPGRAAHVAVLALPGGSPATLLVAVAPTAQAAEQQARLALQ